jgi:transposase
MINTCDECLNRQLKIDALTEENLRLKQKLRYRELKDKEGFFGSSTPSARIPVKANAPVATGKPKGARPGHKGKGRTAVAAKDADQVVTVEAEEVCPHCGGTVTDKGFIERTVLESQPVKAQQVVYRLGKGHCPRCRKSIQASPTGVLPRSLYGNQLIVTATAMHYLHGIPMGRICEQLGIGPGSLVDVFHQTAKRFESVVDRLLQEYRQSPVRHADETGWRINGKNGYAWLFATETISVFQFRPTRSAKVPHAVFGTEPLPGFLVVDRYAGYNKVPCLLQYCYAHLLREVEDLSKEFTDDHEVKRFVSVMASLLSAAMGLRNQPISNEVYYNRAAELKTQIQTAVESPAQHLGIRRIQDIFHEQSQRLYHWASDRRVPAENNLAERDLRPTVIARKVSFGSFSDAGAHTRGILMSVVHSLKKQVPDVAGHLKFVLDQLALNPHQDTFPLLFPKSLSLPSP